MLQVLSKNNFKVNFHLLVPLQFRLRIFPVGGVKSGLEMVVDDDDTLLGVFCKSVRVDEDVVCKALVRVCLSSEVEGSTITEVLVFEGVLVAIVDD